MKISCDVIRDLLPLYVEDMLSNDSKNIVDEHIEQCESCRDELKKLSADETYINTVNNNENKKMTKKIINPIDIFIVQILKSFSAKRVILRFQTIII